MKVILACLLVASLAVLAASQYSGPASMPLQFGIIHFTVYNTNVSAYCGPDNSHWAIPLKCNASSNTAQLFQIISDSNDGTRFCYMSSPTIPGFFSLDDTSERWCFPQNTSYTGYGQNEDVFCLYDWSYDFYNWMTLIKVGGWTTNFIYPGDDTFKIRNTKTGKYCNGDANGFHCNVVDPYQAHVFRAFFFNTGGTIGTGSEYCDAY